MARITVEDCLVRENNRFALVQLASKRTKQLLQGSRVLSAEAKGNKAVVTALREIAEGCVRFMTDEDRTLMEAIERQKEASKPSPSDLFVPTPISHPGNGGGYAADDLDDEEDDIEIEDIDDEDEAEDEVEVEGDDGEGEGDDDEKDESDGAEEVKEDEKE